MAVFSFASIAKSCGNVCIVVHNVNAYTAYSHIRLFTRISPKIPSKFYSYCLNNSHVLLSNIYVCSIELLCVSWSFCRWFLCFLFLDCKRKTQCELINWFCLIEILYAAKRGDKRGETGRFLYKRLSCQCHFTCMY